MPLEDFPALATPAGDSEPAVLKADEFAGRVAQVARAASTDDARPVLTGVYVEASADDLVMAATDSYRLAVLTVDWQQDVQGTVLLPRRALDEARRSAEQLGGEVRMTLESNQVGFDFGDRQLVTRLIEGSFPPFRQLIPSGFERRLEVDRADLIEVVRRVSVVGEANTTATPVTLHLSADTIRVTAGSGEVGQAEESLPGTLDGDDLQIAFNPRYLTDGLDAAGTQHVAMEFRDELKPAVIRPAPAGDDEPVADFLYLLMPVRL
jgi:DNA polymerase-3 subunit beta